MRRENRGVGIISAEEGGRVKRKEMLTTGELKREEITRAEKENG